MGEIWAEERLWVRVEDERGAGNGKLVLLARLGLSNAVGRPRKRRDSSCSPRLQRLWPGGSEVRNRRDLLSSVILNSRVAVGDTFSQFSLGVSFLIGEPVHCQHTLQYTSLLGME
jgi:hypothetical protein